jgi:Zn-dependent protease with chaperone function
MNEDRAARFQRLQRRCTWTLLTVQVGAMLALVPGGFAQSVRDAATFIGRSSATSALTVAIFTVLLVSIFELLALPLRFYQSFVIERRYGLSAVPLRIWIADHLKSAGIGLAFALAAAEIVHMTIVRWPRWWWALASLTFIVAAIVLARIAPIVLLPIFYRFKPLDRASLRSRLESLSSRAGVPVLGVYEWGLGEKTSRANAALVGTGRSRRILLSDTLLAHYTDDEIEVILAHELGHHAHRDIRNGLALEALLIVVSFAVAAMTLQLTWQSLGLVGQADAAALPLILMTAGAFSLLATPFLNALSRRNEHRADRFALTLTERPDAFVSAMRRLAAQNLAEERPSTTTLWLFHTHPPFEQRIQAARAFLS